MSTSQKITFNVVVSSGAKILSTLAALTALGFIARYLSAEEFGWYITALAFFAFFNSIGDWGLYQTATREFSRPKAKEKEIMSNVSSLRITISLLIIVIAPIIIFFLPYSAPLKLAIVLTLFAYVFYSFYQILIGLFQKKLILNQVTIAELVGKVVQVIIIIVGIKLGWSFLFIVSTLLVNMLVNFTLVFFLSRRFIVFKPRINFSAWKKILQQSIPIGLAVIVTFLYFKADTILLSLLQPAEDVGIYGAAYKIIDSLTFFHGMIVGLVFPLLAFNVFSNRKKFVFLVNQTYKVFHILVIPLVVGVMFLADDIIRIVAGEGFEQSAMVLRFIILSLAFIFFGQLFNSTLISAKLQKQLLGALIIAAVFNITLNLIFIPEFSYLATSVVSVATELLVILLGGLLIYKYLKFIPKAKDWLLMALAGIAMALFLWYFNQLPFFVLLIISPAIYFVLLLVFKVITKKEILSLVKKDA